LVFSYIAMLFGFHLHHPIIRSHFVTIYVIFIYGILTPKVTTWFNTGFSTQSLASLSFWQITSYGLLGVLNIPVYFKIDWSKSKLLEADIPSLQWKELFLLISFSQKQAFVEISNLMASFKEWFKNLNRNKINCLRFTN
jgi:hypothetical protein